MIARLLISLLLTVLPSATLPEGSFHTGYVHSRASEASALRLSNAGTELPSRQDSVRMAAVDAKMAEYLTVIEAESPAFKQGECDFMISAAGDTLTRSHIAQKLYDHYLNSKVMGDEAVAIYLYDNWFAPGTVRFDSDIDLLNARVFADFNRRSLIGMSAPELELEDIPGRKAVFPASGRQTVLFFYDSSCSKCNMTAILLRYLLQEDDWNLDFCAVYTGTDRSAWESFVSEQLDFDAPGVRIFNLWDPELASDFQRKYGVLSTPALFLIDHYGVITGRRLDPVALKQLLLIGSARQRLDELCPIGSKVPDLRINGKRIRRYRYLVFYTEGCMRCEKELSSLPRGRRILKVNMDEILSTDRALAQKLFESFDLSVMPFIVRLDCRGRVKEKYISFVKK